jgi:hypothetical protein
MQHLSPSPSPSPSPQELDELPSARELLVTLAAAVAMAAGVFGAVMLLQPWLSALLSGW